ncbi:cholecystokinin [Austrofundulus limnaeus]|uniref:Cholecystokinin n=1 Tax=Austrofundulus limnaeus TaxID=52670 RepID=A0A2I4BD16_AUSLI|nr:PREDICTED: cholecystokinin-like [Austrofundulus limnaeus]
MSGKLVLVLGLLLLQLVSDAASSPAAGEATATNLLQKLLAQEDKMKPEVRAERRAHLSEDEREMMAKQIMRTITEVMNSDCMSDRDYQGWVDFGRRGAE